LETDLQYGRYCTVGRAGSLEGNKNCREKFTFLTIPLAKLIYKVKITPIIVWPLIIKGFYNTPLYHERPRVNNYMSKITFVLIIHVLVCVPHISLQ
jgi:hypothetical protein